jgi:hypothetical protein
LLCRGSCNKTKNDCLTSDAFMVLSFFSIHLLKILFIFRPPLVRSANRPLLSRRGKRFCPPAKGDRSVLFWTDRGGREHFRRRLQLTSPSQVELGTEVNSKLSFRQRSKNGNVDFYFNHSTRIKQDPNPIKGIGVIKNVSTTDYTVANNG